MLRLTPQLLGEYFKLHERIKEDYEGNTQTVQNRLLFNHAQIAAWAWLLPVVFGEQITEATCMSVQDYLWNRCLQRHQRIKADHPLVEQFWDIFRYLNHDRAKGEHGEPVQMLNHSVNPTEIAISLPHLRELSRTYNQDVLPERELKRLLPTSRRHKFIRQASVRSRIMCGKVVHCWVFEANEEKAQC